MHGDNQLRRTKNPPRAQPFMSLITLRARPRRCPRHGKSRQSEMPKYRATSSLFRVSRPRSDTCSRIAENGDSATVPHLMDGGLGGTHVSTSRSSTARSPVAPHSTAHRPARSAGAPYDRTRYTNAGRGRPASRPPAEVAAHDRAARACARGPTQIARPTYVIDADLLGDIMHTKRPKPRPTERLEDLLKAYALRRLQGRPSTAPRRAKAKQTSKQKKR